MATAACLSHCSSLFMSAFALPTSRSPHGSPLAGLGQGCFPLQERTFAPAVCRPRLPSRLSELAFLVIGNGPVTHTRRARLPRLRDRDVAGRKRMIFGAASRPQEDDVLGGGEPAARG